MAMASSSRSSPPGRDRIVGREVRALLNIPAVEAYQIGYGAEHSAARFGVDTG